MGNMREDGADTDSCVRVVTVGDICLSADGSVGQQALRKVRSVLCRDSVPYVLVGNVEVAITHRQPADPSKWASLRITPEIADNLAFLDAAVLANNHVLDCGIGGASDTRAALDAMGIQCTGFGQTSHEAARPALLSVGGIRVAIVGLCCPSTNPAHLATPTTPGVMPLGLETLRCTVSAAREEADAVIAFLHWGLEQAHYPVPEQMQLAMVAAEAGAQIVVGCHQHVIQGYEQIHNTWVFYGLGNLVFPDVQVVASDRNGVLYRDIQHQTPANRESIAPEFEIRRSSGGIHVRLLRLNCTKWRPQTELVVVDRGDMTVDIQALSDSIATYRIANPDQAVARREPSFRSELQRGRMAYWYQSSPISGVPDAPWPSARRRRKSGILPRAVSAVRRRITAWL